MYERREGFGGLKIPKIKKHFAIYQISGLNNCFYLSTWFEADNPLLSMSIYELKPN